MPGEQQCADGVPRRLFLPATLVRSDAMPRVRLLPRAYVLDDGALLRRLLLRSRRGPCRLSGGLGVPPARSGADALRGSHILPRAVDQRVDAVRRGLLL